MIPAKIKIINFGKVENEYKEIVNFYETRISKIARFKKEGGREVKKDYILLDPAGKEMSTAQFQEFLRRRFSDGREVVFAVGPPEGFEKSYGNEKISLSKMTFRHELAYLILLEQLYRALLKIKGTKYEK